MKHLVLCNITALSVSLLVYGLSGDSLPAWFAGVSVFCFMWSLEKDSND